MTASAQERIIRFICGVRPVQSISSTRPDRSGLPETSGGPRLLSKRHRIARKSDLTGSRRIGSTSTPALGPCRP